MSQGLGWEGYMGVLSDTGRVSAFVLEDSLVVNFSPCFPAGKKHDNEFSKLGWIGELNENKYGFWGAYPPLQSLNSDLSTFSLTFPY